MHCLERVLPQMVLISCLLSIWFTAAKTATLGSSSDHTNSDVYQWEQIARQKIDSIHAKNSQTLSHSAKNVILFIGDGMGITTVTAARILKSQLPILDNPEWRTDLSRLLQELEKAEEGELFFDSFESVALSKTYILDSQVGDSGACATALMSGVKANFETVGLSGRAKLNNCASTFGAEARVASLADWAQQAGKSTGLVTTTRVTHATPAALYAHSANRYWESDDKLPPADNGLCKDIARQLVEQEPGKHLNVIMGGGRRHFVGKDRDLQGRRLDGRNLIEAWMEDKQQRGLLSSYVSNRKQLLGLPTKQIDYLLGIFNSNHMDHEADRNRSEEGEPSLAEMCTKAVEVLRNNPNGFFLMVESGRIDHAHHLNNAYRALTDTLALDEAVQAVARLVNLSNTLLVVTADHSHVFTFGGFPRRGNLILGVDNLPSDLDQLPYTTLLYGNGPGYQALRENLTNVNTGFRDYIQQAAVPKRWETHGGEDVPVYATGPGAQLLRGVIDQTYIPHVISYAACMGPMRDLCLEHRQHTHPSQAHCHSVSVPLNQGRLASQAEPLTFAFFVLWIATLVPFIFFNF